MLYVEIMLLIFCVIKYEWNIINVLFCYVTSIYNLQLHVFVTFTSTGLGKEMKYKVYSKYLRFSIIIIYHYNVSYTIMF